MSLKNLIRNISIAALFLVPFIVLLPVPIANTPFNIPNSFFFPFITGKALFFRMLVEVAFAAWVILACLDAKYRPKVNALTVGVTVFALVALLADLVGVNPIRSLWSNFERMEGWITVAHMWMFFMAIANVFGHSESGAEEKKMWHRWLGTSMGVAILVSIYGFCQLFGWADIHQGSTRIDASLGNAIYMAVYMLFHTFIAGYFLFMERARGTAASVFKQWLYVILALVFSFLLFETATRGTILGLLGGVMLALFIYSIFGKKESKKGRYISGGILLGIVILGVVFWFNRDAAIFQKIEPLRRLASISLHDTQTQARGYVWPMALEGAFSSPKKAIIGWGQENFNYIFNTNYNPKMWAHEQWFDRAHNIYLDWLVNGGILGLLAYLALYVLVLMKVWRSNLSFANKSVFTGLVAGYALHNVFVFDNLASMMMFFAILSFISVLGKADFDKVGPSHRSQGPTLLKSANVNPEMVEYIVAPISILALVFAIYFFNVRTIQANTRLIDALKACGAGKADVELFTKALAVNVYVANQEIREQMLSCASNVIANQQYPNPIRQAFVELAMKNIADQIKATPDDARIYVLGGSFLNGIGRFTEAKALLEKGHELSPKKQSINLELATSYLNLNEMDKAVNLLKEAYDWDHSNKNAKSAYILGMIMVGKEDLARKEFADELNLFETEQVANAFVNMKKYDRAIAIYKKLIVDNKSYELKARLAQIQYAAGLKWDAVQTLREIEKSNPELKDQIEGAIKQIGY